jgi:hypothetical protein
MSKETIEKKNYSPVLILRTETYCPFSIFQTATEKFGSIPSNLISKSFKLHSTSNASPNAELLLLPVRTLRGIFTWCTTVSKLEQFQKALEHSACKPNWSLPQAPTDCAYTTKDNRLIVRNHITIEEFNFIARAEDSVKSISNWLTDHTLPLQDSYNWWKKKMRSDLTIVPDAFFTHLIDSVSTMQGSQIENSMNRLLPPEAVFYSSLAPDLWNNKFENGHCVFDLSVFDLSNASTKNESDLNYCIFYGRFLRYPIKKKIFSKFKKILKKPTKTTEEVVQ